MYKIGFIGGHLTPAVAVIEELVSHEFNFPREEIIFFGKKNELGQTSEEYKTIKSLNIKFIPIIAVKINRFFSFRNIISVLFFPVTLLLSLYIMIKFRPRILVSFGGYLSLPACLAGKLFNIKIIIHEGTVRAGAANQILGKIANKTLISFNSSKKYFSSPILVGCPLRREIYTAEKIESQIPMLLISGGHLGARMINKNVLLIVERLLEKYIVVHQTGKIDYQKVQTCKKNLPVHLRMKYQIADYFDVSEFSRYLANCNVIISRSGINTVAEILYLTKRAIFIPLPFSQNNEQMENARLVVDQGHAVIIDQKNLTPDTLLHEIEKIYEKPVPESTNKYQMLFRQAAYNIAKIIIDDYA
jgi:UDP-N-acetylglucosamine--N-acetylmuramyl-(pentapeptide) pyrophosphoryl-undecaprenol N-acetylglucosamine transferase